MGNQAEIDRVVIRWPNSLTEDLTSLDVDGVATVREGEGIVTDVSVEPGR